MGVLHISGFLFKFVNGRFLRPGKDIRMKEQPSFLALTQYLKLVDQTASFGGVFTFGRQAHVFFVLDLRAPLLAEFSRMFRQQVCLRKIRL